MIEGNREDFYSLTEIINQARSFINYLCKKWLFLLLVALLGAGLGSIYYLIQRPKYEAFTTFILEEKSSSGGGLAGIASQFGFNLGSLTGGSIFAGDNILDILGSKKVVQQVLLSSTTDTAVNNTTLADLYLEFTGIKKKWQKTPLLAEISFENAKTPLSPIHDSVLNIIYKAFTKNHLSAERINKKGTIIKVQVTAANSLFARLMTERLVEEASKLYLDIRVGTAQENIRQLQRRSDSLLFLLNNKSFRAAASQPLDINPGIRTASVPAEIATRDKTVLATLYAEVTKNLEASKLLLSQQTPVIQLLDKPGFLLENNKKGLFFLMVVISFVTSFLYIIVVFFMFLLGSNKQSKA